MMNEIKSPSLVIAQKNGKVFELFPQGMTAWRKKGRSNLQEIIREEGL